MNYKKKLPLLIMACLVLLSTVLTACNNDNEDDTLANWIWDNNNEDTNTDIVNQGWINVDSVYGTLPSYINVYKSPSTLQSKLAVAYIAVADMSSATFNILGDVGYNETANGYGSTSVFTPTEFYSTNNASVIVNGGLFFWDDSSITSGFYYSQNLLIRDSKLLAPNQNYYSEDWIKFWYPTLGAFCELEDGTYQSIWTYYTSENINYCYSSPADNNATKDPLEVPSATFPTDATVLNAKTGIGGVTVLLKDGVIKNTYTQEMLDVSANSNQPRTAIGITEDNKLIIFVCEGRDITEGVEGFTTADEAIIMQNLGCINALNLDGGGSSCMLINGKETIQPSEGEERAVLDCISLK